MAIAIHPYTEQHIPAVKAFNQRLAAGGVAADFRFPESNVPHWLPRLPGRRLFQQYYVALEGDVVRGAFILKHQGFFVQGEMRPVVYYHLPISEGIVNKAYATVGVHMLRSAVKLEPMLFALGMGGFDRPLPQMLKAMGWTLSEVPFYFRMVHPSRCLRHIAPLRQTVGRRLLSEIAAFTGSGWIGTKALDVLKKRSLPDVMWEPISSFDAWAGEIWQGSREAYSLVANRDSTTLNDLYPPGKNFLCLKISRGPKVVGWAVVLDTQMQGSKYFGNLRVGSIADAFASPEDASAVVQSATEFLQGRGVDLIVSSQSHAAWTAALSSTGFLPGPSNFIFAASRPLAELLAPFDETRDQIFLNRGDGDGPVNL